MSLEEGASWLPLSWASVRTSQWLRAAFMKRLHSEEGILHPTAPAASPTLPRVTQTAWCPPCLPQGRGRRAGAVWKAQGRAVPRGWTQRDQERLAGV